MSPDELIAALRAVISALNETELEQWPDATVGKAMVEIPRLKSGIDAAYLRLVRVFDERESWRVDGAKNAGSWLAAHTTMHFGAAQGAVKLAAKLESMPHTANALADGRLSMQQAQTLAAAINVEAFTDEEEELVDEVAARPADRANELVDRWRNHHADEAVDEDLRRRDGRSVKITTSTSGMTVLRAELDPEAGAKVRTALQRLVDADWSKQAQGDERTFVQRQADALVNMADRALATLGRERQYRAPEIHLLVNIDYDVLVREAPGGATELLGRQPLTGAAARRLACDAQLCRHITKGETISLEMGRKKRLATDAQRAAIFARDRGCVFPGCQAPPNWCRIHHVDPWVDGGDTDVERLVALCDYHHHLVHEGGWWLERDTRSGAIVVEPPSLGRAQSVESVDRTTPDPVLEDAVVFDAVVFDPVTADRTEVWCGSAA